MDQDLPLHKVFSDYFNKNTILEAKWQEMAENELNESPENYKEQLLLMQKFVSSMLIDYFEKLYKHVTIFR